VPKSEQQPLGGREQVVMIGKVMIPPKGKAEFSLFTFEREFIFTLPSFILLWRIVALKGEK